VAVVECFVEQEAGDGVGGEVALLLDRIARTLVGDRFGEHGLDHGVDARRDADAGDGVELGRQVPHAFGIHPRPCAHVATLPGEAVHAVIVLQAFALHIQPAGELLDRARSGDIGEGVGPRHQLGLLGTVELLGCSGDGVDMIRGDRPVIQRIGQLRGLPNVVDRSVDFAAWPNDFFEALAMRCSGNDRHHATGRPGRRAGHRTMPAPHGSRPDPTGPDRHPRKGSNAPRRCAPPARRLPRSPYRQP
jgi:hypothetical protein